MVVNSSHVKEGGSGQTASVHPFTRALTRDFPNHAPRGRRDWSVFQRPQPTSTNLERLEIPQNTLPLDALPQSDTTGIGSVNMTGECSIANSYTLMGFESNLDMDEFSNLFKLVLHNFRDEGSLRFPVTLKFKRRQVHSVSYQAPSSNQFFLGYTKRQKER
ncbi:hypothetical protein AVEN_70572-1 [Araneus ventricosus]|uniref:Uncharacterized protein n=1 Tax=Araneus ventricosus TaxID=182803 RepID=A0A4Y2PK38_ARAVE|nr:hypothetical protein AVEN_70572-1 [Araneus ventricosus]